MGRSDGESDPIQPDGGLLSLVGDLLFAGAILVMIYPALRRTLNRIDRQFFRQFFYVSEIFLATAALCFALVLIIAQQMRVMYCSFIRPYVGDSPEDSTFAGVLLKVLVCALLVFNYFCATGLQRIVSSFFQYFQTCPSRHEHDSSTRGWRPRAMTSGEVWTNNSNTNSQTPVTQAQTMTHSDVLPSMSFLSTDFKPSENMFPSGKRLYRDVGTMVRFPEYQTSLCTLQFCRGQVVRSCTASPSCGSILFSSNACQSPISSLQSPAGSSKGFCATAHSSCLFSSASARNSCQEKNTDSCSIHDGIRSTGIYSDFPSVSDFSGSESSCRSDLGNPKKQGSPSLSECPRTDVSAVESSSQAGHEDTRLQGSQQHPKASMQGGSRVSNTSFSSHNGAANSRCTTQSSFASFRLPHLGSTIQVRRRHPLPSMPKMTRSGKVYGYS